METTEEVEEIEIDYKFLRLLEEEKIIEETETQCWLDVFMSSIAWTSDSKTFLTLIEDFCVCCLFFYRLL